MPKPAQWLGQAVLYSAFALVLGYFSVFPRFTHLEAGYGIIRISFSHAGETRVACRRFTQAELDQLAPNMRRILDCPRERVDQFLLVELDGKPVYQQMLPPLGIAGDGAATAYARIKVPAGTYHLRSRLRDSRSGEGFNWDRSEQVTIAPGQNFVIGFQPQTGGFRFLGASG